MGYSKLINAVDAFHDANCSLYINHQKDVVEGIVFQLDVIPFQLDVIPNYMSEINGN